MSTVSRTDYPLDPTTAAVFDELVARYGEEAVRGVLTDLATMSQQHRWIVPNLLFHIQGRLKEVL